MTDASSFLRSALTLLAAGLVMSSCSSAPKEKSGQTGPPKRDESFWIGDQVAGSPKLVIDLSEQRLRYYKGGKLVGLSPISSGRDGHDTPTGNFKITQKDVYHRSSIYGAYVDAAGNVVVEDVDSRIDPCPAGARFVGAKMHYFMRVVGAVGMHEGYLPGYPASHGCIRLPTKMASIFYHATPHGTPVQVTGNAAYAKYEPPVPLAPATSETAKKPKSNASDGGMRPGSRKKAPQRGTVPPGTTLYL